MQIREIILTCQADIKVVVAFVVKVISNINILV